MKRILIATHPLGHNYGGIAQAYALQTILKRLGHNVESTASDGSFYKKYVARNKILRKILRKQNLNPQDKIAENTAKFIAQNISSVSFDVAKKNSLKGIYDAYIAGSDQVWRKKYVHVPDYLFSFVRDNNKIKISYAASFGRDDLAEYSRRTLRRTRKLARRFTAISVREKSGISLAKRYWGTPAECHIDPTLLLKATDYLQLIENSSAPLPRSPKGGIFAYTLDSSSETVATISFVEKILSMTAHQLISGDRNNNAPLPPIEQWFQSFDNADFIITDSFHGTVFSIIFHKPFIAIGNAERGLARFNSLLNMLGLENRLITSAEEISVSLLWEPINWGVVDAKLDLERNKAMEYLRKHLK